MTLLLKKLKHYQLISQSYEQQKQQLAMQLQQVTQTMSKKQASLTKFKTYLTDYEQQSKTISAHNAHAYRHKQLFLDKLASVMMTETTGLEQLTGQKNELLINYQQLMNKIDGLQQAMTALIQERTAILTHIDETYYNELALTQATYQATKDGN